MPTPADLLSAVVAYWADAGLDTAIGHLTTERAAPGATFPRVVVESIKEPLPGRSAEDRDVEITFAVQALTMESAQAGARALYAALDPRPSRTPLAWAGGAETTNVRNTTEVGLLPGKGPGGVYVYRAGIPYCFRISGDP
jgi:hypothetical protein